MAIRSRIHPHGTTGAAERSDETVPCRRPGKSPGGGAEPLERPPPDRRPWNLDAYSGRRPRETMPGRV